jgi:hypothetical protein
MIYELNEEAEAIEAEAHFEGRQCGDEWREADESYIEEGASIDASIDADGELYLTWSDADEVGIASWSTRDRVVVLGA